MAAWLETHPQVYISPHKEPHYFSSDIKKTHQITLTEYEQLFSSAKNEKIVIEASTRYLYSQIAIKKIQQYNPDAKFLAMLRNPAEMVISLHNHLYAIGVETEKDLETAWHLQDMRAKGKFINRLCTDPDSLQYGKIASLGKQIEVFFNAVPIENRRVLVFDDLKKDPAGVYQELLSFAGLQPLAPDDYKPRNQSFAFRSRTLTTTIKIMGAAKRQLGFNKSFGILNSLSHYNRKLSAPRPISDSFRRELSEYFMPDVEILARLLNRNFNHWIKQDNHLNEKN